MLIAAAALVLVPLAPVQSCELSGAVAATRIPVFSSAAKLVIGSSDDAPLFRVSSVVLSQDLALAVSNTGTNEILIFSADGALVRRVGGTGGGPSEFARLGRADWYPGDLIAATDMVARKVAVLDFEDGFVDSRPFRDVRVLQRAFPLSDGRWLSYSHSVPAPLPEGGRVRGEVTLALHAVNGDHVRQLMALPGLEIFDHLEPSGAGSRIMPPFAKGLSVAVDRTGCVWVSTGDEPVVRAFDLEGRTRASLGLPVEATRPVTRAEWDARLEAMVQRADDRAVHPRLRWLFNQIDFAPSRPAAGRIRVDDERRLWVGAFHHADEDVDGWWVFAGPGSEPVWVAAPPATRRLLEVRYGHAVLLHVDALGVETVSLHGLVNG